ncbi:cytochrome c peroxidase [Agriterribacter sp.]|uniref:cytochrome-c peroxidase n=1 Tax=Agriterribacter sp. TaxID=2821509 RepID=UPI002B9DF812|nr:cytochrome c peroxidase [Agriterribacter sp.]HRO47926.1 cytochrome c peroxidase [Agriterribacter sp.]HRQ19108.1 cytochrome c peroxidase [Agriterribacter sp.]
MMHRAVISLIGLLLGCLLFLEACKKQGSVAAPLVPLQFIIPPGFPDPVYKFENNTLSQQGFELGKKLFYDGRLSQDGNFPCASCHQQFAAFATFDHPFSHGFNNQFTTRNAPGLFNVAWMKEMHWDGGINHIEVQPLAPIVAENEMAETIDNVIAKLKDDAAYRQMFKTVFGDEEINSQRMLKALTQFVAMLVSADSKYDKVKRGTASFTEAEAAGYQVFQAKCAACHTEPLFTDHSFRNTGLPVNDILKDVGRMHVTGNPADSLKFKVPSLRNVYATFPYGHDGRFYSIGAVIDHYRFGVVSSPTTDPLVKDKIAISDYEKLDLLAFLRTLTDSTFINNKSFAAAE